MDMDTVKRMAEIAKFWQEFADKLDVILISFEENYAYFKLTDTGSSKLITRDFAEKVLNFKPRSEAKPTLPIPLTIGDRVRLWNTGPELVYGIVVATLGNDYYMVRWDSKHKQYHRHDLVKVEDKENPKFKVGDRVRYEGVVTGIAVNGVVITRNGSDSNSFSPEVLSKSFG